MGIKFNFSEEEKLNIQKDRLISLIEFVQETAKMKQKPVYDVSKYDFCLFEQDFLYLPGVQTNIKHGQKEVWISLNREKRIDPPTPENEKLKDWLEPSSNPLKQPELKELIEKESKSIKEDKKTKTSNGQEQPSEKTILILEEISEKNEIQSLFSFYLNKQWIPWSYEEKQRRKSISIYDKIFKLKRELEDFTMGDQREMVCGIGIANGNAQDQKITHPILTRPVNIKINDETMAIEICPSELSEQLEIDIFISDNNPGANELEKKYTEFCKNKSLDTSPFEKSSFETILVEAAKQLEAQGTYITPEDRKIPPKVGSLCVTDTWVLISRPRSKGIMIQDLKKFKDEVESGGFLKLSGALRKVLSDPLKEHSNVTLPTYRGLSTANIENTQISQKELYFPLPFNEQQSQIIQLLECYKGVVVQGPPGTGKTHTIANITSHYLALGKRVLVTSMKEPALSVLKQKLPLDIQCLSISLLMNEVEGMKQFEQAITKISSTVAELDRLGISREIEELEQQINHLHSSISITDKKLSDLSKRYLEPVFIGNKSFSPKELAKELIEGKGTFEWLKDELALTDLPNFTDLDIKSLREALNTVGENILYLNLQVPSRKFTEMREEIKNLHENLSKYNNLKNKITNDEIEILCEDLAKNTEFLSLIETFEKNQDILSHNQYVYENNKEILSSEVFENLGKELSIANQKRQEFLVKDVTFPVNAELNKDFIKIVIRLSEGKGVVSAFFPYGSARNIVNQVKIMGDRPPFKSKEDWSHVLKKVNLNLEYRKLTIQWNNLSEEINLPKFASDEPIPIKKAIQYFRIYQVFQENSNLQEEIDSFASRFVKDWPSNSSLEKQRNYLCMKEAISDKINFLQNSHLSGAIKKLTDEIGQVNTPISEEMCKFIINCLGNCEITEKDLLEKWDGISKKLSEIIDLDSEFKIIKKVCADIESSGAPICADQLKSHEYKKSIEQLFPHKWREGWRLRQIDVFFNKIDFFKDFKSLTLNRQKYELILKESYESIVTKKTLINLVDRATPDIRSALEAFRAAVQKTGKGTGKSALRYRRDAQEAVKRANPAIPCWIMPHWKVSEMLPAKYESFDLVIIDEASQSDLSALPALLRAKKILVVGDDKQISPEGVGIKEENVKMLMTRHLSNQYADFRSQLSPDRSIYDLFKVVFPESSVMLKEHFRCVEPIIEYSKREHYNHELKPLRTPTASERLDPPLIDIFIEGGHRVGTYKKNNPAESRFIVSEIKKICEDPNMENRSIGVISLLGDYQAFDIWKLLHNELTPEKIKKHSISCGDAKTFQGKERDIIFLSMVVTRDNAKAMTRSTFIQRYNVAASRARDRMYLVRSIDIEDLSPHDHLRFNLIKHFSQPYQYEKEQAEEKKDLCESDFEKEIFELLVERGYQVTPQVKVGNYRIDMVVEGENDRRLAIECDGDRWHGVNQWDNDINRQRSLERVGWKFWRCFASVFISSREKVIEELVSTLEKEEISPLSEKTASINSHTTSRKVRVFPVNQDVSVEDKVVLVN